jgi:hypothetical protein
MSLGKEYEPDGLCFSKEMKKSTIWIVGITTIVLLTTFMFLVLLNTWSNRRFKFPMI